MVSDETAIAWVESPLQLLCVVEWAAARRRAVRIVPRSGALQLAATAQWLEGKGLPSGVVIDAPRSLPAFGVGHWVIGDPFSGMARSALALRSPQRLTIVDDGAATLALPAVLDGTASLHRATDTLATRAIADIAATRVRQLNAEGALEVFSYYALDLASRTQNRFRWLRSLAISVEPPSRVFLGSAAVTDGLIALDDYAGIVERASPAHYFPHRRETVATAARIAEIAGVQTQHPGLPIELVLAGARGASIVSMPSSAVETLRIILLGSGSTVDVVASLVDA